MKKVGILGGTFDPPHLGHLIMAEEVLEACELDEVWFLPTFIPPHKEEGETSPEDRIAMVEKAIKTNPSFHISLIEYERKGRSYTYDTLKELKERHPENHFHFIIGADMVLDLPNWQHWEELGNFADFVGVGRPGFSFEPPKGLNVIPVSMPQVEISSSMIRERIKEKRSIRYFLQDEVKEYIVKKGLYE